MDQIPRLMDRWYHRSNDNNANNTFDNIAACGAHDDSTMWQYCPSETTALVACGLFGILTLAHISLAIHWRKAFCWVIILGALFESLGYGLRAYATQYQLSMEYFSGQILILLVTPLIINAWIYMILGRLIEFFIPEKTVGGLYGKRIAVIFVFSDILTFTVQLGAVAMLTIQNTPSFNQAGGYVFMAGAGMQQASLTVFGLLIVLLHRRMRGIRNPHPDHPWAPSVFTMYAVVVLISIRTVYKLVEYVAPPSLGLPTVEWTWYAFDAAPIFLVTALLVIMHPGRILQGPGSEYGKTPKEVRKSLVRQYHDEKAAHKRDLDFDGAKRNILPSSRDSSPFPRPLMPPTAPNTPPPASPRYSYNMHNGRYEFRTAYYQNPKI